MKGNMVGQLNLIGEKKLRCNSIFNILSVKNTRGISFWWKNGKIVWKNYSISSQVIPFFGALNRYSKLNLIRFTLPADCLSFKRSVENSFLPLYQRLDITFLMKD